MNARILGSAADSRRQDRASLRLTPRQLEVLSLLCQGCSNKLICRRLDIRPGTVKVHISRILRELGVENRLQAVLVAHRLGLAAGGAHGGGGGDNGRARTAQR